ncbi:MAG: anti-sigma28 factor FlgM [Candidatus Accumulibacter sp. BA-94]|uniref:flagellar biosynthesis anti-sigma factor FlgM n=1 Tax=Accumulibacter sp. TaxID=2053492 RepID=UPI000452BD71|nr:flagellar biosynthesis anti-sigma factor FlgM [Accumulibacter sp.]EXI92227.1 MAG: anti-sigma28 factor FlgM [Candidatus Accumulibacter sp. BA-94]MBL8390353.1 flagellar biosynthesis anti-sigma factor FlgM [Accumulibacter sp.]HRD87511.1 flagellar biosynthesis anti-sigma factor FlgM [Accumulibacter sp.]
MKIDSTTNSANALGEMRDRAAIAKPATSAATEVHLSKLAAELQSPGDVAAFDSGRVAEIRQAIAEGRFTISADAIAERLIASASELVAAQQRS